MKTRIQYLVFTLVLLLFPSTAKSQTQADMQQVISSTVVELNKQCPMVLDECVIKKFSVSDNYFVMDMVFTTDNVNFTNLSASEKKILKDMIMSMIMEDENMLMMQQICGMAGLDMKVLLKDKKGTDFPMVIPCK